MEAKDYVYFNTLLNETDFENFKSNVCHFLKNLGDRKFLEKAISEKWIPILFHERMLEKAFYLLAVTDYLAWEHDHPLYDGYNEYRKLKLPILLIPRDLIVTNLVSDEDEIEKAVKEAANNTVGRFFLRYNIIETNIRNAV